MSYQKNWCFTEHDCNVKPFDWERREITYCVWQLEVCPSSGKEHLQGFVQFTTKRGCRTVRPFPRQLIGSLPEETWIRTTSTAPRPTPARTDPGASANR